MFFDREELPPGETYGERIRRSVARCHLFVFLVSPGSITPGSHGLTELEMVRAVRRRPAGTRFVAVGVSYIDGTDSDIQRFPVPGDDG